MFSNDNRVVTPLFNQQCCTTCAIFGCVVRTRMQYNNALYQLFAAYILISKLMFCKSIRNWIKLLIRQPFFCLVYVINTMSSPIGQLYGIYTKRAFLLLTQTGVYFIKYKLRSRACLIDFFHTSINNFNDVRHSFFRSITFFKIT